MGETVKVTDMVLYALDFGPCIGQLRPAIVVRVWSPTCVNLQVVTDGQDDGLPAGLEWRSWVPYEHPDNLAVGQNDYWC